MDSSSLIRAILAECEVLTPQELEALIQGMFDDHDIADLYGRSAFAPLTPHPASASELRSLRFNVAADNRRLILQMAGDNLPRTIKLNLGSIRTHLGNNRPKYVICMDDTVSCAVRYAKELQLTEPKANVCLLNFANGHIPGGGYKYGAKAQEEDICRQMPELYASFMRDRHNLYPFGSCAKRSNVLFTQSVSVVRKGEYYLYEIIPGRNRLNNISVVSAAAPNVKKGEKFIHKYVKRSIKTIMQAPLAGDKYCRIMILGAWGCGAFGCDPQEMARLFAEVLNEGYDRIFNKVVFAIPPGANHNCFKQVLEQAHFVFEDS